MDILFKRKMSRRMVAVASLVISLVIILLVLWLCAVVTDYSRFKSNKVPVFTISSSIEDKVDGYTSRYNGIGYAFIQNYENSTYTNEFYILNYKIAEEDVLHD